MKNNSTYKSVAAKSADEVDGAILKLFGQKKPLDDSQIHALADTLKLDPHQLENQIYEMLRSVVAGGKTKGAKEKVDPKELASGIEVEAEHTENKALREKIARDHLAEDPLYYTHLKEMEAKYKPVQKSGEVSPVGDASSRGKVPKITPGTNTTAFLRALQSEINKEMEKSKLAKVKKSGQPKDGTSRMLRSRMLRKEKSK
jgi:hypothetical protein